MRARHDHERPSRGRLALAALFAAVLLVMSGVLLGTRLGKADESTQAPTTVLAGPAGEPVVPGRAEPAGPAAPANSGPGPAAARFLADFADPQLLGHPDRRRQLIQAQVSPAGQAAMLARIEQTYAYLESGQLTGDDPARIALATIPVGYRVRALTGAQAEVSVWVVSLSGEPDTQVISWWTTSVLSLRRIQGAWRVEGVLAERSGPTPSTRPEYPPSPPAELVAEVATLQAVR